MNQPLVLSFEDFRKVINGHRIYFYEGIDFFDFHFLSDNNIIKTRVMSESIENYSRFFSDRIFYGATRIKFNIPVDEGDILRFTSRNEAPIDIVQDEEIKNSDIQEEGVE